MRYFGQFTVFVSLALTAQLGCSPAGPTGPGVRTDAGGPGMMTDAGTTIPGRDAGGDPILPDGGGFIPYAAYRVSRLASPGGGDEQGIENLRRFYFDTALSGSSPALAALLDFAAPGKNLALAPPTPAVSHAAIPVVGDERIDGDETFLVGDGVEARDHLYLPMILQTAVEHHDQRHRASAVVAGRRPYQEAPAARSRMHASLQRELVLSGGNSRRDEPTALPRAAISRHPVSE